MADFYIEIIECDSGNVVERIGPVGTERMAERVEDGVLINLDHEHFETRIVTED